MRDGDIELRINGARVRRPAEDGGLPLLDVLHEYVGLTGTKLGCGIGLCRACTVAVQDEPAGAWRSVQGCLTPLAALAGKAITTVEGLAVDGRLHPLQEAFLDEFAFQCGYCTPGFLMAAFVFLDELARAPAARGDLDAAVARALGNNVCRCTGYVRYVAAVRKVVLDRGTRPMSAP